MIRIERFEAVEIAVPSGSTLTRFYFPDLPNLRNSKITSIQVYTAGTISATPLTGSTPVTTADLKKSFLTLYQGDLQLVYNVPMISLNNMVTGSSPDPYTFELPAINGITVSWVKSYVNLPSALATTGVAYSFGVYYNF
jgi:hypothetical protein